MSQETTRSFPGEYRGGRAPAGWLHRVARRLVHARLAGISAGSLELREPEGETRFGPPPAASPLRARLTIHRLRFYSRAAFGGSLGAAEAYLRGEWSTDDLVGLLRILLRDLAVADRLDRGAARLAGWLARPAHWLRRNTRAGSARNIPAHYDLGNEFFALFLDPTMTYSCGLFEQPHSSLEEAQVAKLDRVCRKLRLGPGDRLVEIGTGWGSLAIHAARRYGCRVTTATISPAQRALALERVRAAGLADRVEVLLADYRELRGRYSKLVSVEMIEAVGYEFLPTYFGTLSRLLEPDGLACIQAILMPERRYAAYRRSVDFIQRYVFPGGHCPSLGAIAAALARSGDLAIVELEDLTLHYARTLACWRRQFWERIEEVRRLGYPEPFIRLWDFYLAYCEAGFAERYIADAQLLLAKPGCRYDPVGGLAPPAAAG